MTKITSEHLVRGACVYIRQSTADQRWQEALLANNAGLTREQLDGLVSHGV